jgi:hypothetical protein
MSTTSRTRRAVVAAAWVSAGALGATALTGLALADERPATASGLAAETTTATAPAAAGDQRQRLARLRSLLHGSLTIETKDGVRTIDVQRGEVTAASAASLTVLSSDGFTATYTIGDATTVTRDRARVGGADLVVGDQVMVRASGGTAENVRALSAQAAERLRERLGDRLRDRLGSDGSGGSTGSDGSALDVDPFTALGV